MSPIPHTPRRRPHWWPANEPWPPHRPPWVGHRGGTFRQVGCLILLITFLGATLFALLLGLVANALGLIEISAGRLSWLFPLSALLFIVVVGILAVAGRRLRRFSRPFDDLVRAAGRIAEGDYSARVTETGPPDVRSLAVAFNKMAARLQSTDQQRRELLADATHELRTPLTIIQGNLEGMLDGVYNPEEARLRSLLDETEILERLIEDLRTLALAESGALELRKEPVEMGELIENALSAFQVQAASSRVNLVADIQPELPVLELDPERIRQVIVNLVANAMRYTPSGGEIRVICRRAEPSGIPGLAVTVHDTGLGIPPEDLPHVFDRFYKSRDSGGMGLGMSIARSLVELHGGAIQAASTPGQGTTISFTLPGQI